MELSDEDRARIYAEEKVRDAARKQLKQEENRRKNKKILYWFLGIFAFFMIAIIINPPSSTKRMNNTNEDAYAFAETFVDARLKAPSTAEHATPSHARITANKDRTLFEVSSYVDSENSFGAKIRSQYTVKMRYDVASDKWFLLDLKLE